MTRDEGGMKDEGRRTKDEGRRTRDEGRGTRDEGRRTRDEGRKEKFKIKEMKKKLLTIFCLTILTSVSFGQTSAGKCWNIDYLLWNKTQPRLHFNCGNSETLNPGGELTLEVWVKAYTFGENRKIMGKMDDKLNNGYVMGFQDLNIYTEYFTPALQNIVYPGSGAIPRNSAFVHLASVFSMTGAKYFDYLNGVKVGESDLFPPAAITVNESPFIIGSAPWDAYSFQFYGAIDEIRVWNVARTADQLQEFMHKELKGDEPGLIAYYNFNNAHDSIVPDESSGGNIGVMKNGNDPCWSYADSYSPVGDEIMYGMYDVAAAWFGKSPELFNYATTTKGLTVIAAIEAKEFNKYVLFGHNAGDGKVGTNPPPGAPADFQRMAREWYLNKGGQVTGDMYFDLTAAAGGGGVLPSGAKDSLYVLMHRTNDSQLFRALAHPVQVIGDILVFKNIMFEDGFYCIGYASTVIPITPGATNELSLNRVRINPNPASDHITVFHGQGFQVSLINLTGQVVKDIPVFGESQDFDVSSLAHGLYFVRISKGNLVRIQKLIVE